MDKREEEISRGHEAERILRSPVYQEAFQIARNQIISKWLNSAPDQEALRERLFSAHKTITAVEKHLERVLTTGKMAQKQVEDTYG